MESSPLLSSPLKNGLTLLCMDQSKKIAADRWYICIEVQITIPVKKKWFVNYPVDQETFRNIRQRLGEEIIFKQKKERHFISDDEKKQIVQEICSRVEDMGMKYYCHDDFAAKYILKIFADHSPLRQ